MTTKWSTVPEIPRVVRLVRSVVLSIREEPYVEAAISVGTRLPLVLIRHVLPNTVGPLIVQAAPDDRLGRENAASREVLPTQASGCR